MRFSIILSTCLAATPLTFAQQFQVPVPWAFTDLSITNTRHGTGGTWQFSILDSPTTAPQGFNTTCHYYSGSAYYFAIDDAPIDQPCTNPKVTFSLYPSVKGFTFNVTHLWGPPGQNDNGTWNFSADDVVGQEMDVRNNFGQSGGFGRSYLQMYPQRAAASEKCEFC